MSFKKVLLYPFSANSAYFEGYSWAVELAIRMKAKLQLFTTTSIAQGTTETTDTIYHSLLEAHGYYLQHYPHDGIKSNDALREPLIAAGELKEELIFHLKKNAVDIVILDPLFLSEYQHGLREIVKESGGVIVLSQGDPQHDDKPQAHTADHFYDHLCRAQLHKLPENFFTTLSKDHTVFNYLRKFFQKNRT